MKHWGKFITALVLVLASCVVPAEAAHLTRAEDGNYRQAAEMEPAVPVAVSLAGEAETIVIQNGLRYALGDSTASVVGYTGKIAKACQIPAQITVSGAQYTVTSIAANGFLNCSALTSVVIPETVTEIGDNAFTGCTALTGVTIPAQVSVMGNTVFSGCTAMQAITVESANVRYSSVDGVLFDADHVLLQYPIGKTNIRYQVPAGTEKIGEKAFYYAEALEGVALPDSVTEIGAKAFAECCNLTTIDFGNGLKTIRDEAFWDCPLEAIALPASIKEITTAFNEVQGVQSYTVEEGSSRFFSQDGVLFENGQGEDIILRHYPNGRNTEQYSVPENVSVIGEFAFSECWELHEINLPETLTEIQFGAFTCCGITRMIIPDGVTELTACTFQSCTELQYIELGNGVTCLEWDAFYNCARLEKIMIPEQVTEIQDGAFEDCTSLRAITVSENNEMFSSVDGILYDKDQTALLAYPGGKTDTTVTLSAEVTSVTYGALSDCEYLMEVIVEEGNPTFYTEDGVLFEKGTGGTVLHTFLLTKEAEAYRVPDGVTEIAPYAFDLNGNIRTVDTNGVKVIGVDAFADSSLYEIILPSVTTVEGWAFMGTRLTTIAFPAAVTTLGIQVIDYCDDLEYVVFRGNTPPAIESLSIYGNDVRYIYVPEGTQVAYKDALADKCNAGAMIVEGDYVPEETVQEKIEQLTEDSTVAEINEAATEVVRLTEADADALSDEALLKMEKLFQSKHPELRVVVTDDAAGTAVTVQGAAVASGLVEYQDESGEVSGDVEIIAIKQESASDEELLRLDFTMYVNEEERDLQAPVIVSVTLPEAITRQGFTILHYLDDGEVEEIGYALANDVCTFRASSFSSYVFQREGSVADSQITYATEEAATLFLVEYAESGQMMTVEQWSVSGTGTKTFWADSSLCYKAFLLDEDMRPVGTTTLNLSTK